MATTDEEFASLLMEPEAEAETAEAVEPEEDIADETEAVEVDEQVEGDEEQADVADPEEPKRFKAKVDGQEVEVTLDDLLRSYSGQEHIQKGMRETATAKKAAETAFNALQAQQAQFLEFANAVQAQGLKSPPAKPDAAMLDKDPVGYLKAQARYEAEATAYFAQQDQIETMRENQRVAQKNAHEAFLAEQKAILLQKLPDFADPVKGKALQEKVVSAGMREYGFTEAEVRGVTDARLVQVLNDAAEYRALKAKMAKAKQAPEATRVVKPAASRSEPTQLARAKTVEAAKKTQKTEDWAAALLK